MTRVRLAFRESEGVRWLRLGRLLGAFSTGPKFGVGVGTSPKWGLLATI